MIVLRALNPVERLLLLLVPVVFVAMEGLSRLVAGSVPPHRALSPFYNNIFFTGAAAVIALSIMRRADRGRTLLLGALFEAARIAWASAVNVPLQASLAATGLGIWGAALVLQAGHVLRPSGRPRRDEVDLWLTQFALPVGLALTFFGGSIVRTFVPNTVDPALYAFDGLLPVPAARWVASFTGGHPWFQALLAVVYNALFATFAVIVALESRVGDHPGKFVSRVLLIGLFGFLLYFIAPGVGPHVAIYHRFIEALPDPMRLDLAPFAAPVEAPRNAMPSLHTTYALVMLIAAARFGARWFAAAAVFAALTMLATLGLREHYIVDLVVAVPLALASAWFVAAFDRDVPTGAYLGRAALAFAMVIAWLVEMRLGVGALRAVPWLASVLVLATLAAAAAIGIPPVPGRTKA
ncbi:MAG: phosphatase PAP2 family protein [Proteobacteria bacterium]|nr:phosphatase PAP2 family protein [Pseudomonadota bacterium]